MWLNITNTKTNLQGLMTTLHFDLSYYILVVNMAVNFVSWKSDFWTDKEVVFNIRCALFLINPGLDKSRTCVPEVLEIINFTNCCTRLFFIFQFTEYMKQLQEIRRTCTLKQSLRQFLKTNNVTCFSFHVLCPSSILNILIASKINLQWSCLPVFSYPPSQTI